MQHYLAPLLKPQSVALVGASDQPGSLGRTVFENLLAGHFKGDVYAVNPNHRRLFGRPAHATLAAIGKPVDLAVIATPPSTVTGILDDRAARSARPRSCRCRIRGRPLVGATWRRDVAAIARKRGVRIVGPGAFGVVRTDIGLNATFCAPTALPGRLALVAQSGAVCTAMLDFAAPMQIGFSTVISLGGGIDIGFGELLDALVHDPVTDGILLYVESVGDARAFLSALRAAARTKPVVVLKAGRSRERARTPRWRAAHAADAVFDAALKRSGTVRVRSYTQLFAAARILAMGKIPRGDRLAIVSNGRGPGLLAADARTTPASCSQPLGPPPCMRSTRCCPPRSHAPIRSTCAAMPPAHLAAAVATTLADPDADAVCRCTCRDR